MTRLIQGFFFQNRQWLDVAHRAESEGGVGVVIKGGICRFMYAGVIFPDSESETLLVGEMFDHFGESKLFDIEITPKMVRFTKQYDKRKDLIHYKFRCEGKLWVGEYSGVATGEGHTKCIITEVPDSLFVLPE